MRFDTARGVAQLNREFHMGLPEAIQQAPIFWIMMAIPIIGAAVMTWLARR